MKVLIIQAAFLLPDDFDGNARDGLRAIADYGDSLQDENRITPDLSKPGDITDDQLDQLAATKEILYNRLMESRDEGVRFFGAYSHAIWDEENQKWIQFDYDGYPLKENNDESALCD